jgi:hypothetical protein
MRRVTMAMLQAQVNRLNDLIGTNDAPFFIDSAYGGYRLYHSSGYNPLGTGYLSKPALSQMIDVFRRGIMFKDSL